ncbi:MAG TPA: FAD-binding oxidoreductase, partial [Methanomassiliicoccales archaeon]|nr:FAD-binding oxidoreductase [Methanomassiliicoccales archaeon]
MVEQSMCGTTADTGRTEFKAHEEKATGLAQLLRSKDIPDMRIVSGEGEKAIYSRDQSDVPGFLKDLLLDHDPDLVVQPRTIEAVVKAIAVATELNIPIIARGAASSPFGGAVPVRKGMVIDMSQMDRIIEVDHKDRRIKVQAGARWADVDHELSKSGLRLRTSPSSKFSTVGGWVAGGGIGIGSLGHGHLSKNVLSIQLATVNGVRSICPSEKLFSSVFGSEGQLGIITEVTLAVNPIDPSSRPHLVIMEDLSKALQLAHRLRYLSDRPEDLIYFSPGKMRYLDRLLGQQHFPKGHALLVTSGNEASENAIHALLSELGAREEQEYLARLMWHERYFPMKLRRLGPGMLGAEVFAPNERLEQVLYKAEALCREFALDPLLEVHFIQGLESLLLCYYLTDQSNEATYALDAVKSMIVTAALVGMGSRPYSLGIWNNSFVDRMPEAEVSGLRLAKDRYDPDGLMNQGKYFQLSGRLAGIPSRLLTPAVAG